MSLDLQMDLQCRLTMPQLPRLAEVFSLNVSAIIMLACVNLLSLRCNVDKTAEECADAVLAKVEMDRKLSMIKAWEESEKSKAENK